MTPQELINDPDFQQAKPETQKWALQKADPKKWGNSSQGDMDAFLAKMKVNWGREDAKAGATIKQMQQLPAPPPPGKTSWEKAVEPVTKAVGRGVEIATEPLVGLSRMARGESAGAAFGPETFSASHPQTANQVASGIVPQSPWQAGAMAGAMVPGMAGVSAGSKLAGPLGRVAGAAVGAGGLQGLLGSGGVVEGGNNIAGEAVTGAAKGAATQMGGEVLGKLMGGATRIPGTGRGRRIERGDLKNVAQTVGNISPELAGQGKIGQAGAFFTGGQGAKDAAGKAFEAKITDLESKLLASNQHPYIDTIGLRDAFKKMAKVAKGEPALDAQIQALAPSPYGFLPDQAAKLVSLTGERLKAGQTGFGHIKDQAMNDLVAEIEASLPANAKGLFSAARAGYAKASGLRELMGPAFTPGKRGYGFDIRKLQQELSTNPDLANRFTPNELQQLFSTATRGASTKPGMADIAGGRNVNVPYPSPQGFTVAALRNLVQSGKHVGNLPGTLPQGAKGGLGVAASAAAGQRRKED